MEEKNSEKEKVRFWQKKSLEHISSMRAARAAGLLPKQEGWRNVVEHELVESEACDVLAESLGLNKKDRAGVVKAASIHDVYKRKEKEDLTKYGPQGYDISQEEEANFLRSRNFSEEVISLAQSVGHGSLLAMVKDPLADKLELKDDIKITTLVIHYVDDITLNNDLVPLNRRIDYLNNNPNYRSINELGKTIFNGRMFFEVQREVSRLIQEDFASRLNVSPAENLPLWIKSKIESRIHKPEQ